MRPAVDAHHVYFGARDGQVYFLGRFEGRLRWKHDLGSPVVASPALARCSCCDASTSLFAIASGGRVACLDAATGRLSWAYDLAREAGATPILYSSPTVQVRRDGSGERRRIYFGAALQNAVTGSLARLYCLQDRVELRHVFCGAAFPEFQRFQRIASQELVPYLLKRCWLAEEVEAGKPAVDESRHACLSRLRLQPGNVFLQLIMITFVNIVDRIGWARYVHRHLYPVYFLPEGSLIGHKKPAGRKVLRHLRRFVRPQRGVTEDAGAKTGATVVPPAALDAAYRHLYLLFGRDENGDVQYPVLLRSYQLLAVEDQHRRVPLVGNKNGVNPAGLADFADFENAQLQRFL
ncbi:MAG: PQQ-binding-like beta-propeller repeat protein [Firmicutes bacterium]|nr:PQQ-binding-like beta-propeller repeat protein [Bacillota bacterium]